jgi:heme A synthase
MESLANNAGLAPRWLHRWAVLTAAATAVLLAVGAVVTTFRVGMADPVWPTYPWHLLLISWQEPSAGFLIEHTHRLAGYLVGCCVIVLAVGLWAARTPRWLKMLGGLALAGVIIQGLLGGFRVYLNALLGPNLAAIHGLFAQVVFTLLVSLAVLTSPRFAGWSAAGEPTRPLRRIAVFLAAVSLMQLSWGVLLRHLDSPLAQRGHFVTAFLVVAAAAWLASASAGNRDAWPSLRRPLVLLAVLLCAQVLLGVEAWLSKYLGVELPEAERVTVGQAVIRTAHVLVGSWILATSVGLALLLWRPLTSHETAATEPGSEAIYPAARGLRAAPPLERTA